MFSIPATFIYCAGLNAYFTFNVVGCALALSFKVFLLAHCGSNVSSMAAHLPGSTDEQLQIDDAHAGAVQMLRRLLLPETHRVC